MFEEFDYSIKDISDSVTFIDAAFLATHVVLVLTNYGENPVVVDRNIIKAQKVLEETYQRVRHMGYVDLLAEYLQCFKILKPGRDTRVCEFEDLLFGSQRADGSFGMQSDFRSNAYNAFHPTWSVLTAPKSRPLKSFRLQLQLNWSNSSNVMCAK